MGDGDGWVRCAHGHRHWGRFGACGLLLVNATGEQVVLQHRAQETHEGDTWGVPGGARDSTEDYVTAALREAQEEGDIAPASVFPVGWQRVDHGGWSYTTVLARALGTIRPRPANWESNQMRWWPVGRVAGLPLHPGFAASWPQLQMPVEPLTIVVDGMQVEETDLHRLTADATAVATAGLDPLMLPTRPGSAALERRLPRIVLIVDGVSVLAAAAASPEAWPQRQVSVVSAIGSVPQQVEIESLAAPGSVILVTDDAVLPRVGVEIRGRTWWQDQVGAARSGNQPRHDRSK